MLVNLKYSSTWYDADRTERYDNPNRKRFYINLGQSGRSREVLEVPIRSHLYAGDLRLNRNIRDQMDSLLVRKIVGCNSAVYFTNFQENWESATVHLSLEEAAAYLYDWYLKDEDRRRKAEEERRENLARRERQQRLYDQLRQEEARYRILARMEDADDWYSYQQARRAFLNEDEP